MDVRTLFNGVAGLKSYTLAIESTSNNISNLSTTGYKATRAEFLDLISQQIYTGNQDVQQAGNGVMVELANVLVQGDLQTTENVLDLAVSGDGFFAVTNQDYYPDQIFYTRAGEFHLDAEGYIVNSTGYRLQGFAGDVATGALTDLQVPTEATSAAATTQVDFTINLDAAETDEFTTGDRIDPSQADTANYALGYNMYDDEGNEYSMALYFQKMESFSGPSPADSNTVWKVASFWNDDGTISDDPAWPENEFYLHFDTNGHLVGTTTGTQATGDSYQSDAEVSTATSAVSDQVGEALTYTGANGDETYYTSGTVSFLGNTVGTESVTIGADTYNLPATATAADAAADLADQINSAGAAYYAIDDGSGNVTIYSEGAAMELAAAGSNVTADDETGLDELIDDINDGLASTGALYLNLAGMTAGTSTITVDGNTFTYGAADDFTTAAELATLLDAVAGIDADSTGDGVYIAASSVGTAGNAITMSTNDAANVILSSATLLNGLDDSATSLVEADSVTGSTGLALELSRTDTGAAATLTPGVANTLGANLGLDFNAYTQLTAAGDGSATASEDTSVSVTYTLERTDDDGNVVVFDQTTTLEFAPEDRTASTQSAGDYETSYLNQDGYAAGTLTNLEIDSQGIINGLFSNGESEVLGAVALTTFISAQSLNRFGENLWVATEAAGEPQVGLGEDPLLGLGSVESGYLEGSSVDLATEMVNLINYQRSFQANSKSVTTADEMLQTAINLIG